MLSPSEAGSKSPAQAAKSKAESANQVERRDIIVSSSLLSLRALQICNAAAMPRNDRRRNVNGVMPLANYSLMVEPIRFQFGREAWNLRGPGTSAVPAPSSVNVVLSRLLQGDQQRGVLLLTVVQKYWFLNDHQPNPGGMSYNRYSPFKSV